MALARPVLCLHGFTGTPFDVDALARALVSSGYAVETPMLPGHGGSVADLAATTAADWLAAADAELTRLAGASGSRVAIAGASMGALLALRLARRRPDDVAALVLMAAALRWRPIDRVRVRILSRLYAILGMRNAAVPKKGGVDIADPEMRALAPSLKEFPVAGLDQVMSLSAAAAADLPYVSAPALVIHGRLDRAFPLDVSEELASKIGSSIVERLWLNNSGHLVAVDRDRALVAERVGAFLDQHAIWELGPTRRLKSG
jgi:carboxylesterase